VVGGAMALARATLASPPAQEGSSFQGCGEKSQSAGDFVAQLFREFFDPLQLPIQIFRQPASLHLFNFGRNELCQPRYFLSVSLELGRICW